MGVIRGLYNPELAHRAPRAIGGPPRPAAHPPRRSIGVEGGGQQRAG